MVLGFHGTPTFYPKKNRNQFPKEINQSTSFVAKTKNPALHGWAIYQHYIYIWAIWELAIFVSPLSQPRAMGYLPNRRIPSSMSSPWFFQWKSHGFRKQHLTVSETLRNQINPMKPYFCWYKQNYHRPFFRSLFTCVTCKCNVSFAKCFENSWNHLPQGMAMIVSPLPLVDIVPDLRDPGM